MICSTTRMAEKLFCHSSLTCTWFRNYYKKLVSEEIHIAGITCEDKVLCIGSGSIPSTAIELAEQSGASIYAVDIDNEAVRCGRDVISRLGLSHKVFICSCPGEQCYFENYEYVHIAMQVTNKKKIIEEVFKRSKNTKVILRIPKEEIRHKYECIDDYLYSNPNINIKHVDFNHSMHTVANLMVLSAA